jgi:hypothetical protein
VLAWVAAAVRVAHGPVARAWEVPPAPVVSPARPGATDRWADWLAADPWRRSDPLRKVPPCPSADRCAGRAESGRPGEDRRAADRLSGGQPARRSFASNLQPGGRACASQALPIGARPGRARPGRAGDARAPVGQVGRVLAGAGLDGGDLAAGDLAHGGPASAGLTAVSCVTGRLRGDGAQVGGPHIADRPSRGRCTGGPAEPDHCTEGLAAPGRRTEGLAAPGRRSAGRRLPGRCIAGRPWPGRRTAGRSAPARHTAGRVCGRPAIPARRRRDDLPSGPGQPAADHLDPADRALRASPAAGGASCQTP